MRRAAVCVGVLAAFAGGCSEPCPLAIETAMVRYRRGAEFPACGLRGSKPVPSPGPTAPPEADGPDVTWLALAAGPSGGAFPGRAPVGRLVPWSLSYAPQEPTEPPPETWLALSEKLARQAEEAHLPAAGALVPYARRRGPAYPGDILHTCGRDAKELPVALWDDTKAIARDRTAWILLGLAAASGAVTNCSGLDGRVADHYMKHGSDLSTFWDMVGDVGGNPGLHFAVAGVMYFHGQAAGNVKEYEVSKTLVNALAINGLLTLALKGITSTESPNGEDCGWPSGHASSSFCFATVMYHAYGPWAGVPLLAFAGFVGYERVQARNHDFSDVISGALIGIAIGHVVCQNHEMKIFGMDVVPYSDPRGGIGLALIKRW